MKREREKAKERDRERQKTDCDKERQRKTQQGRIKTGPVYKTYILFTMVKQRKEIRKKASGKSGLPLAAHWKH